MRDSLDMGDIFKKFMYGSIIISCNIHWRFRQVHTPVDIPTWNKPACKMLSPPVSRIYLPTSKHVT